MLSQIADTVTILVVLLPITVQVFGYIAQKSHNQKLINLNERATIVVRALESTGLGGEEKKKIAMNKLSQYASEVGIKVTGDQLDDYIESAVGLIKNLTK